MKMKFLLIAHKYYYRAKAPAYVYYDFPVGLSYISAMLKYEGHEVLCLNLNHYEDDVTPLQEYIRSNHFDVLCMGGLSGDYGAIDHVLKRVREVRRDFITILGGGIVSSEPEIIIRGLDADYGVIGEGEWTIRELADALQHGADPHTIKGIIIREKDGTVFTTPARPNICHLDEIPFPDYDSFDYATYLDMRHPSDFYYTFFSDTPRHLPIIGSRSCPYKCTFCYHPLGDIYRSRSMENIFQEVDLMIERHKVNAVMFYDELFAVRLERIEEFCGYMRQRDVIFQISMRVDQPSPEILDMLKEAGCFCIGYGLESASPRVLKSMRKKITVEQMDRALSMTRERNIGIQAGFIFGDTAETMETVKETLDWWRDRFDYQIQLNPIRTYPGSALYRRALKNGVIKDPERFNKEDCPLINVTGMSGKEFDQMNELIAHESKTKDHLPAEVIAMDYIGDNDFGHGLYAVTLICPRCGETSVIRNVCDREHIHRSSREWMRLGCRNCFQKLDIPFPRAQRITRALNRLVEKIEPGRLAVYGTGGHTKMLFDSIPGLKEVTGLLLDREPSPTTEFESIPVLSIPEDPCELSRNVDAVLISSEAFEPEIFERIEFLQQYGISVIRLYR